MKSMKWLKPNSRNERTFSPLVYRKRPPDTDETGQVIFESEESKMKRTKKTMIGKITSAVLSVAGVVSFALLLSTVGTHELGLSTSAEFWSKAIPCILTFGGSIFLHNVLFD